MSVDYVEEDPASLSPTPAKVHRERTSSISDDYNVYKTRLAALCDALDEYMLLAGESPYQHIEEFGACYCELFATQEWIDRTVERVPIPERRPPDKTLGI